MTIMEAIERAKRLRQGREGSASERQGAADGRSKARSKSTAEPAPMARLQVPRYELDPRVCEQSRILVPSAIDRSYSTITDAYRILRTRLWAQVQSGGWDSVAITSAGPGEGKSVTALNLAMSMAFDKKRNVFLLDLDLRNPSICRYIGAKPKAGIGNYLAGEVQADEILFSVGVDNLILAGGLTSYVHSAELLGSGRLQELIAHIRSIDPNAMILADLPPLLSTADALVVAPLLSATVLVVADGVTQRDSLDRAIEVLAGVKVAGIVLNHARESIGTYYG